MTRLVETKSPLRRESKLSSFLLATAISSKAALPVRRKKPACRLSSHPEFPMMGE
jgi:hypothetical protein